MYSFTRTASQIFLLQLVTNFPGGQTASKSFVRTDRQSSAARQAFAEALPSYTP
jgi:hypothetical protein